MTAIEAVLPTLVTKADLADLRAEMRLENQQLAATLRAELEKLATKLHAEQDKLATTLRAEQEKLEATIMQRLNLLEATLLADARAIHTSLFKWMVTTMLTMLIAFSAFFIGLGNLLVMRAPPFAATPPCIGAPAQPGAGPGGAR